MSGHFRVASGSDDGSLHLCVIDVSAATGTMDQDIRVLRTFSKLCAHAAHVTGVQLLPADYLLSVSVDQRLILWRLCEDGLSFVHSKLCHVADVAASACWEAGERSYHTAICGQGLEVLRCTF